MTLPRGIRNNNPLNIRKGAAWNGRAAVPLDTEFVTFEAPEWGYRAAKRIISSYKRRGLETVSAIIYQWAPTSENNTNAYLEHVLKQTKWPSFYIPSTNDDFVKLFKAMAVHENGAKYVDHVALSEGKIRAGLALV